MVSFGLCWNTSGNPKISDNITSDSVMRSNRFTDTLTGLKGGTKYYLRAYAVNTKGIGYGNEVTFTTLPAGVPEITTTMTSNITYATAVSGGKITNDGGATFIAGGVCWSEFPSPTITNNKTIDRTTVGEFISTLTELKPERVYHLRAYATNTLGTAYGNDITFTTPSESSSVLDADGNIYNTINIGNQVWFQQNLKTTRYSNGDLIGTTTPVTLNISMESSPKYQWAYNGIEDNAVLYGRLYTWFAVNDNRNICPTGWHVATRTEWQILLDYLTANGYGYGGSGDNIAKAMAETFGWVIDGTAGNVGNDQASNNKSRFSALPSGGRISSVFGYCGIGSYWMSATEENETYAQRGCYMYSSNGGVYTALVNKKDGYSVRCLRNN
jgi:uncharacterized protein (TIGR02145 family)